MHVITGPELQAFLSKNPNVILDVYADWCGPCKRLSPILEAMEKAFEGKLVVAKVDADNEENADVVQGLGVTGIPALFYFRKGQRVHETVGLLPKDALEKVIKEQFELR